MPAAAQTAFHRRVTFSIDATVRTPPSSPATGTASVPSRPSSAVGSFLVPSFSFRRWTVIPFIRPSGARSST
jgi:hypothetical protein